MKEVILDAESRTLGSKGMLAGLRKEGKVPAVLYGKDIKAETIVVDSKAFISIIEASGANVVINLNFKDGKKTAIVKSLQRDILTQDPIHIDFKAISLKDKIEVLVPIHIEGVADGVKNFGGLQEFIVREVNVKALPTNIPQKITVDVSALGIGQGITIADLPKLDGVEYTQNPSTLIVHVVTMKVEEDKPADAAAGAEVAQPEVISKGKKDKEGEEGAAAGAKK
ncbi:MAG: 50S ribosomal protein L25 [Endomicrobia bacterium]|nr:50S ribosomal protein L25 [Endomicrobiia bacterium]MCL2506302.1 50S ribosomal protein L25 [Endomicrobiia bacterium]